MLKALPNRSEGVARDPATLSDGIYGIVKRNCVDQLSLLVLRVNEFLTMLHDENKSVIGL